jgi:hypothetical protein
MKYTHFNSERWYYLYQRACHRPSNNISIEDQYVILLGLGATEVATGRLNNWSNQPDVVCFRVPDACTLRAIDFDDRINLGYGVLPVWKDAELCDRVNNVVLPLP